MQERDYMHGKNFPLNSYGMMGFQWGYTINSEIDGKTPTSGAPMTINTNPIGMAAADRDMWKTTYGCSMDSVFTLINGKFFGTDGNLLTGYFVGPPTLTVHSGWPNLVTHNTLKKVVVNGKEIQQVQYVVSGDTSDSGVNAINGYETMSLTNLSGIRSIGLRVPMMAGGWGKTIDMLPTDPDPVNFSENDDSHKLDRATWKYGPIDLRWDYRRNVWTGYNDLKAVGTPGFQSPGSTWVFGGDFTGTDPDNDCRFPLPRAPLSDVWTVRRTFSSALLSADPGAISTTTAKLLTTVNAHLYDDNFGLTDPSGNVAPLSDVFVIPDSTEFDASAGANLEGGGAACGRIINSGISCPTEITGQGVLMIRTTSAIYSPSENRYGPIMFIPETGGGEERVMGDMVYDEATCKWRPEILVSDLDAYLAGHGLI